MKSITKFLLAVALLCGTLYANAKVAGAVKADSTELVDRHLSGFTRIKIAGPFEVHLKQGTEESVKVETPEDVKDRITAEVVGSVLKIHNTHDNWSQGVKSWYSDKSVWHNHKKIVVYIIAKDLTGITVSGSGGVTFDEGITAAALKLRVRGSGQVSGKVEVTKLESDISGSGNIKLSGSAENSKVRVIGSGKFTGRNLITVNSAAHVSGSGNAEVNASDEVDAVVHGSGVVTYAGTVKSIKSSKSGSGEISRF